MLWLPKVGSVQDGVESEGPGQERGLLWVGWCPWRLSPFHWCSRWDVPFCGQGKSLRGPVRGAEVGEWLSSAVLYSL